MKLKAGKKSKSEITDSRKTYLKVLRRNTDGRYTKRESSDEDDHGSGRRIDSMKRERKSGEGAQMLEEEWPGAELGHASKIKSRPDIPI
jgi:hypothetical protein